MSHNSLLFISIIIIQFFSTSHAEITFDGSLGPAIKLRGPNYTIDAAQGNLVGSNLFHSFHSFNLNHGESAAFTGPESVANIIGRITGGSVSQINGPLKSTIGDANLYLLNPHGFIWGPNASLDINGSFYLSSADYLRFEDSQHFNTNISKPLLLSIAAPEAFGFLNEPSNITINGHLQVAEEQELAIIGGDIGITTSHLYAPKGHIKLVSAASAGEVKLSNVMKNNTFTQFGQITLKENTFLNVNAQTIQQGKSGSIMILGGQFFLTGQSQIQTLGYAGTGNIEIKSTEQLQIADNSQIRMLTTQGEGGKIILSGQSIQLSNDSTVWSETWGQGQSGDIVLESTLFGITENASIGTSSLGEGNGGSLILKAQKMNMNSGLLQAVTFNKGNAGDIAIQANNLELANGSQINTSSENSGQSGNITVNVKNKIDITGYFGETDENNINPGGIASSAFGTGDGGSIQISAPFLNLDNWATIQTLTKGEGNAGDISINVNDLRITNGADIDASNEGSGTGRAGNIDITANNSVFITATKGIDSENMFVVKDGYLGGIYSSANKQGTGGDIELSTKYLTMRNGSVISVGSEGIKEGNAGNINLNIGSKLDMNNAAILTKSIQAGGNLTIKYPWLFTLKNSELFANAKYGNGGNINIYANQIQTRGDSQINASSEFGLNGQLLLNNIDIAGHLTVLSIKPLNAAKQIKQRCINRLRNNMSSFNVVAYQMLPLSPNDFHSLLPLFNGLSSLESNERLVELPSFNNYKDCF
jgi:filamentous hemagglutinin family protein